MTLRHIISTDVFSLNVFYMFFIYFQRLLSEKTSDTDYYFYDTSGSVSLKLTRIYISWRAFLSVSEVS